MDSMMRGRRLRSFTGIERWDVREGGDFFHGSYVAVFSIEQTEKQVRRVDRASGISRRIRPLVITCAVNFLRLEDTAEKRSTLQFVRVEVDFEEEMQFSDYARIQREFEIQANAFLHRTKAKKPNFRKRFAEIDLRRERWGHWFQD